MSSKLVDAYSRRLTLWIFIGFLLGVLAAVIFGESILPIAEFTAMIFLRLLKMIIVPLIITSITTGVISAGSAGGLGRLGLKTLLYYTTTSLLAILTGLFLVNIFKPGVGAELGLEQEPAEVSVEGYTTVNDFLTDFIKRIIPENPFAVISNGEILPIIFFCILFGIFVTRLEKNHNDLITNFFQALFEVMMKLTHLIILLAPIGIFGLIARIIATTGFEPFKSLGVYFITVLLGLGIHFFVTLPVLIVLIGRFNPWKHIKNMSLALITAFSTSSSSATLPLTIQCAEEKSGISNRISSFVLPLGATVNMDGTALYECVAAIFIAQAYGIELSFVQQFIVVFTSLLASIGAAGIPMAGLVMISIILKAVGLPLEGVGLILAVDRILDMCRTTTNVFSDSTGALVIAKLEGELNTD